MLVVQPQHRRENWQFVSERISAWLSNYGVTQITTNQAGLTCYHRLLLMSNDRFGWWKCLRKTSHLQGKRWRQLLMAKVTIKQHNRKKTRRPRRLFPLTSCLCWTDGRFEGAETYITLWRGGILGMGFVPESQRESPFYHSH